jgi:hypothetical protein
MSMKVSKISFCNTQADNVVETTTKEQIITILKTKYSINFKSNRAMILNAKTLKFLRNPHFISVKTTGTNYFLFLTNIDNINYAFYIDRKIKQGYTCPRIISVKYSFSDDIFKDTLIDGELVKDSKNNWMFLMSDLIISEGVLLKQNITHRINTLYSILNDKYREDKYMDICPLAVKRLFSYGEYNELLTQFLPNLKYGVRGLYFNSLNTKHANHLFLYPKDNSDTNSKNYNSIKHKNKLKITKITEEKNVRELTFEIKKTIQPEIYDLYYLDENKHMVKYENARISTMKTSKLISKLFKENDEIYVLCKFNSKFNKWEPYNSSEKQKVCSKQDLN